MKAAWIDGFIDELAVVKVHGAVAAVSVYAKTGIQWHQDPAQFIAEASLDSALGSLNPQKLGRQKKYLYSIPDAKLVVAVEFSIFPKKPKIETVRDSIAKAYDTSQHKYDALHDSLTSCKNRKSFDKAIKVAFEMLGTKAPQASPSLVSAGTKSVSLVTLDIDHFKRVNDSRGHDYGDLVLRGFSWMLEDQCIQKGAQHGLADFQLFRLGGEEFNILITGEIEEREVLAWVESVRATVHGAYIPSTAQLEMFNHDGIDISTAPAEAERRITASFGISRISGSFTDDGTGYAIGKLKTQADKALYSAKNSGRNRVRYFPEILKNFGRVLENDAAAATIIIDIGSEVGVVRGREFFVVPEKYTGENDFVVDDGRSRRKLGSYPRLKIAKIVTFDVQPEISFCSITEQRDGVEIRTGCLLESIPLGLFGGLSAHHSSSDVIAETDWRAQIKERVKAIESGQVRVMAIRISSVEEVEKKHGAVKVNDLLGAVVATVTRLLPRPAKISQVEVGQFGIVFSCGDSEIESISEEVIAALVELCREIAEFSVGIFDHRSIENVGDSRYSLDYSYAYDYALIAAAAAGENSGYTFDEQAPRIVLTKQTDADKYEQVSADYKKFKEIGIFGVDLDNQAGISYFTSGNILEANAAFRVAVEHGTDPTLRSNYAISLFYLQRFHEAYEQMRQSAQDKDHGLPSPGLIPLFAIAAFESNKRNGSPPPQEVKRLIDSALQVTSHTFGTEVKLKEVSESFSLAYPEI